MCGCDGFGKPPRRVLDRVLEYLFWVGIHDDDMNVFTSLPLGHRALLPALQTARAWRKRAARLFYRFVVVVIGGRHTAPWEVATRYRKRLGLRTNVRLVLESGYAPKATHLLVYSNSPVRPAEMGALLARTGFADFVWAAIGTLYFFHPHALAEAEAIGVWSQDEGVARINESLALSLPHLASIRALSNTRDSFGLFALDDLISASLDAVDELVVLSNGSLVLGARELPRSVRRLVMRTTLGVNSERNADDSRAIDDAEHPLAAGLAASGRGGGGLSDAGASSSYRLGNSSAEDGVSSYASSRGSLDALRRRSASSASIGAGAARAVELRAVPALRIPRVAAEALVFLELGPISPDGIWAPFTASTTTAHAHQRLPPGNNPRALCFPALRTLKLAFSCGGGGAGAAGESDGRGKHRRRRRHRSRHRRHRSRRSNRRRSSTASGDDQGEEAEDPPLLGGTATAATVDFPCLESLSLAAYPYDIVEFLGTFPCAQLRRLELIRCPHGFFRLSLADNGAFARLSRASFDIPRARHGRRDQEDVEAWVSRALGSRLLSLQCLSLAVPPDYSRHIELPPGNYGATNIQRLRLACGLRLAEIEKLLCGLPGLRMLEVTVTEVMSRTHEYLSRTAHRRKYAAGSSTGSSTRPWSRDRLASVLSVSLEDLAIRYVDLSQTRLRRAVAKTVLLASRAPSLLRVSTQLLHLAMLRECVGQAVDNKSSALDTAHLRSIKLEQIVGSAE
ncbi:hypothetical protein GGI11_003550 [Coemansia sp. RSA 2049]|nr:hypothetical protein GGI11_003550 [Coemansia sp. RSA 2049]